MVKRKSGTNTKVAERRQAEDTLRRLAGELGAQYLEVQVKTSGVIGLLCRVDGESFAATGQNLDDAFVSLSHQVASTEESPF